MKTISITIGITSILVMLFQTYLISGIYAINEKTNTTMDIDTANLTESAAIGVAGDVASIYKFKEIIAEGKSTLLNVLDIKPNTLIKYNTIACLYGPIQTSVSFSVEEMACDKIGVIEEGFFTDRKTPAVSLSLLAALNQGIEKPITSCYRYSPTSEDRTLISTLDCHHLFILYK